MKRHSKYRQLLEPFLGRPSFSAREAVQAGITHQALSYFTEQGIIERVSYGHYRAMSPALVEEALFEDLAVTAATIPNGVICLISALKYHDLTEEIMRAYWIAVPHSQGAPARPHVRIIRMRNVVSPPFFWTQNFGRLLSPVPLPCQAFSWASSLCPGSLAVCSAQPGQALRPS